jgi:hypothetical protein
MIEFSFNFIQCVDDRLKFTPYLIIFSVYRLFVDTNISHFIIYFHFSVFLSDSFSSVLFSFFSSIWSIISENSENGRFDNKFEKTEYEIYLEDTFIDISNFINLSISD